MTGHQILQEIDSSRKSLTIGIQELKTLAIKKAEAESKYKIELRKQLLFLRSQGHGINMCIDLAKGHETVSNYKLEYDIAESSYFIALEHIKSIRQDLEVLKSLLSMEKFLTKED